MELILQIVFISFGQLIELTELDKRLLEPTIIERHFALLIATFSLLVSSKKFNPLGASLPVLEVKEKIATAASLP